MAGKTKSVPAEPQTPADDIRLDDIMKLEPFVERYSDLVNEPQMRWLIFNRFANGLAASGAIVKKGGRWHVVVPRMKNWLLSA
jgi:hypothetical protein